MRMQTVQRQPDEELVQKKPVITPLVERKYKKVNEEKDDFLQTKKLSSQSFEVTPAILSHIQSLDNFKGGSS